MAKLQSSSCGNPGVPPKGILYGTTFQVGDKIRYSCVTGYVLDGHPQLTCVTNMGNTAVWDFPIPICRGESPGPSLIPSHQQHLQPDTHTGILKYNRYGL
ncbi:hypothetical protein AGOR_G00206510 [Albula goreensis]|uniref:Sushi domain-containing protein n=1 Tax=Albula goreensis TaxID=1534307 RepID=A0A8T3CPJ9_9TELE|nr:hypothetical protein AGOR_G00206510 [Albula goreensis]